LLILRKSSPSRDIQDSDQFVIFQNFKY
jgi:hypothetical protein